MRTQKVNGNKNSKKSWIPINICDSCKTDDEQKSSQFGSSLGHSSSSGELINVKYTDVPTIAK